MTCLLTVICANWKSTFLLRKWNHSQCWHTFPDSWNKWTVHISWNHAAGCLKTYLLLLAGSQSVVNRCHTRWMKALEWLCICWCLRKLVWVTAEKAECEAVEPPLPLRQREHLSRLTSIPVYLLYVEILPGLRRTLVHITITNFLTHPLLPLSLILFFSLI